METKIKLPELPKNDPVLISERTKTIEYSLLGKLLSDEETKDYLQKWVEYISKLIPKTEFDYHTSITRPETPKEAAIDSKSALISYHLIMGKEVPPSLLESADKKIAEASETYCLLMIQLFEARWILRDEQDLETCISSIEFRFEGGEELAVVWPYDEYSGNTSGQVYINSWKQGIELYVEFGKKWISDFAPESELPVIWF